MKQLSGTCCQLCLDEELFVTAFIHFPLSTPGGDLPNPGIELMSPALAGGFFTTSAT